jgi:hypothetical protein
MSGEKSPEGQRSHPLVGLLFWMLGKNLKHEDASTEVDQSARTREEEDEVAKERLQRRSLSWKDDNPNENLATWHEFVDVKGADVVLAAGGDKPQSSSLKAGTTLQRHRSSIDDDDNEDAKKRRSPNSPNWGFFVSITPPAELYPGSAGSSGSKPATSANSAALTKPALPSDAPVVSPDSAPTPKRAADDAAAPAAATAISRVSEE